MGPMELMMKNLLLYIFIQEFLLPKKTWLNCLIHGDMVDIIYIYM